MLGRVVGAIIVTGVVWRVGYRVSKIADVAGDMLAPRCLPLPALDAHRLTLHGFMHSQASHLSFASLAGCAAVAAFAALLEGG